MPLSELDLRIVKELGIEKMSEEDQKIILKMLDERLVKRFLANLLVSLPEDKKTELSQKVEAMGEAKPGEIIETVIELNPDAKEILEKSTVEVVEEAKEDAKTASSIQPPASSGETKTESGNNITAQPSAGKDIPEDKGQEPSKTEKPIENDYYQPIGADVRPSDSTLPPTDDAQDVSKSTSSSQESSGSNSQNPITSNESQTTKPKVDDIYAKPSESETPNISTSQAPTPLVSTGPAEPPASSDQSLNIGQSNSSSSNSPSNASASDNIADKTGQSNPTAGSYPPQS